MSLAALILMGGKATRMGGKQKAFLTCNNQMFYQHVADCLSSIHPIYLSVASIDGYEDLEYPVIEDTYFEIGPLGGICSALEHIQEEAIFVIPCDMPNISKTLVDTIITHYKQTKKAVTIKDRLGVHPLVGIYTKDILGKLQKQVRNKQYIAKEFVTFAGFDMLSLDALSIHEDELININSPKDMFKIQ